ncbi:MAG: biotin--[acetyl-CoA-carboxylase] ligase [Burkholderiaceae bacterium]
MFYNAAMNDIIHASGITACCSNPAAVAVIVEVVDCTGSTSADLVARLGDHCAADSLKRPTLRLALQQTAGRGRAGRAWHSDAASLTFSLAWQFAQPVTALVGLPLAVGVTVAEVLRERDVPVSLKWPNDLVQGTGKLGGILIETVSGGTLLGDNCWAVIGIGLNMRQECGNRENERPEPPAAGREVANYGANPPPPTSTRVVPTSPEASTLMRGRVAMPITALPAADRTSLTAALLDALVVNLDTFATNGFTPFTSRWNRLHAYAGRPVDIIDRGQVLHSGYALGVDSGGRLLLDTALGTVAILAGDVSLRPSTEA